MPVSLEVLNKTFAERSHTIIAKHAQSYAAATNDPNPAYSKGELAPPVYGVVVAWDAYCPNLPEVIPADFAKMTVHGEHDMWFHQPLRPGQELISQMTVEGVRVGGSGTRLIVRVASRDARTDAIALDQYYLLFIRGLSDGESKGADLPDHAFPEESRARPMGEYSVHVDEDQTFRYAAVSGDTTPIHLDADHARSVGLPGIIVHGLCTMAMTGQAVIETAAGGAPDRLRRLAVRFAKPVLPGDDITTTLFRAPDTPVGGQAYAFEASTASGLVITNGWAEVEP